MIRLLSIISLVLALVLFPPAVLALVSNNAVPGDATYPIKRILEDGIFAAASLNPVSKAWFAAARSDRRFKEFTTLVTQGKKSEETLNELVEQTQVAASQIAQVNDEGQKQQLIAQLSQSIQKYDQGLQQLSTDNVGPAPAEQTTPVSQITAVPIEPESIPAQVRPTVSPQPRQTLAPIVRPTLRPTSSPRFTPAPSGVRPVPVSTAAPTIVPTSAPISASSPTLHPTSVPTPVQSGPTTGSNNADRQRQIDEARRQLEEIRRRLGVQEQRQDDSEHRSQNEGVSKQENKQSDKKDESKDKQKRDRD